MFEKNSREISEYSTKNNKAFFPYKFFCIFRIFKDDRFWKWRPFPTKMLIITINLNEFFFYECFRKSFKKATKCCYRIFVRFFSTVMRQITNGQKIWWFLFFIFDRQKTNKHPNAYFINIIWKLLKILFKRAQAGLRRSIFCWNIKLWSMGKFGF